MSNNKNNQITDYKTDNITTNVKINSKLEIVEYVTVFIGKVWGTQRSIKLGRK